MKTAKIVTAVVLFVVAGVIFFFNSGEKAEIPQDADTMTAWKCAECGKRVDLSATQVNEMMIQVGNVVPIICPACSKQHLYQIAVCPVCSTEFFGAEVPGHSGRCPKCSPELEMPDEGPTTERRQNYIPSL